MNSEKVTILKLKYKASEKYKAEIYSQGLDSVGAFNEVENNFFPSEFNFLFPGLAIFLDNQNDWQLLKIRFVESQIRFCVFIQRTSQRGVELNYKAVSFNRLFDETVFISRIFQSM